MRFDRRQGLASIYSSASPVEMGFYCPHPIQLEMSGTVFGCHTRGRDLRESIPRHIDKKSGGPQGERSGVLEEQIGVWSSQGGGKDKLFFFPSTFLSFSHIKHFFSLSLKLMIT